jgi:hypothetical protein
VGCAEARDVVIECSGSRVVVLAMAGCCSMWYAGGVSENMVWCTQRMAAWAYDSRIGVRRDRDLVHVNVRGGGGQHSGEESGVHGGGEEDAQGSQNVSGRVDSTQARDGGSNARRQFVLQPCAVDNVACQVQQIEVTNSLLLPKGDVRKRCQLAENGMLYLGRSWRGT